MTEKKPKQPSRAELEARIADLQAERDYLAKEVAMRGEQIVSLDRQVWSLTKARQ